MRPTVLVATASCWFPTARLAMALADAGFTVDALCPSRHPLNKTSILRQTHPYYGLKPLISLKKAIAISQPDLIVPGDDLAARHLHDLHRQERTDRKGLEVRALIERSVGASKSFPVVQARTSFIRLALEEGVRVPTTEVVANIAELRSWVARMGFPTVLKANGTSGGEGVRIVQTLQEAEREFRALQAPPLLARVIKRALVNRDKTRIWSSLLRRRSVVNVQAYISGREATSLVACWKGNISAALHFEVVEKGSFAGPATVVHLIEDADISEAVQKIVRRLNLSGIHGFDFVLETHSGNPYLIEINPRATQVGHLRLGPGRDLPAALYAAISGGIVQTAPRITDKDTIALFPQEWMRNPSSAYLRLGYHDVPWEQPDLVRCCIPIRPKRGAWYSERKEIPAFSTADIRG